MPPDWQRFAHEARRIHERYLVEVVEAFGLCPWARDARLKGKVNLHVTPITAPDPRALLADIDACMRHDETEIGMLVCPLLALSRTQFRHLLAEVRAAEEQRHARDQQRLAFADFHPNAPADLTTPERLVPFIRRAPDPMVQIIRTDVLARVRGHEESQGTSYVDPAKLNMLALDELPTAQPSGAARIAQANMRTVQRVGVERLAAIIESIHADRHRAYAALGADCPTQAHVRPPYEETVSDTASNSDEKPEPKTKRT